ncbi:MAG: YraN family protein [Chitinispirillales bacterium]|jgi:putative endonuclease|nr:YraN family protein [Chitinispirillales bacterium]
MNTHEKGKAGEDMAVEYLLARGYVIEARNYRTKKGELDIVAVAPDGTLVFVEVKAARSAGCGNPLYRITQAKKKTMISMAQWYMYERQITNRPCRMDVIGIYGGKVDHIPNAFFAS